MILQSGVILCPWALALPGWQKGLLLAEKLGKKTTDLKEAGEFLQTADANKIIDVSQTLLSTRVSISTFCRNCHTIQSHKYNVNLINKIVSASKADSTIA